MALSLLGPISSSDEYLAIFDEDGNGLIASVLIVSTLSVQNECKCLEQVGRQFDSSLLKGRGRASSTLLEKELPIVGRLLKLIFIISPSVFLELFLVLVSP